MGITEVIGVSILSALVTSYLAYYFGFQRYLKQKTREEIKEYYIKDGIDKVIKILNKASFLCDFNFGKAMRVIEYLEKSLIDKKIGSEVVKKVFSEMRTITIAPPPEIYKIQLLIGQHQDLFAWIIKTLGDYSKYIDYLRHELFLEVDLYFQHSERFDGKEQMFFEKLKERTREGYKVISSNEPLRAHLLNLRIRVDEIGIFSMKDFDKKALKDKRIKEISKKMEKDYKKLKENKKINQKNKTSKEVEEFLEKKESEAF